MESIEWNIFSDKKPEHGKNVIMQEKNEKKLYIAKLLKQDKDWPSEHWKTECCRRRTPLNETKWIYLNLPDIT